MRRAAGHIVAMLARWRRGFGWALVDGTLHRSKVLAIAQRVQIHTKDRAVRECIDRDTLLSHCCGTSHFHTPGNGLPVRTSGGLPIGTERNKMDLGMVRLGDEAGQHAGKLDRLCHVVHRKRMVRQSSRDYNTCNYGPGGDSDPKGMSQQTFHDAAPYELLAEDIRE